MQASRLKKTNVSSALIHLYLYGKNQSGHKKAKYKWDFCTLYFGFSWPTIFIFALMETNMYFMHLEASHIMSF